MYTEVEELGSGGFARVYKVHDEDGLWWAKKVYSPKEYIVDEVGHENLTARFIREVRQLSSIDHPNVIAIVSSDLEATPPYFIMELADGTLETELAADPTLGGNASNILADILAGLEELHRRGMVHRDLKPSNILRIHDPESGLPRYVIADFGLITGTGGDSSLLTATGQGGGTARYAAPELISNFKRATPASDIYSVGAILHEIFFNTPRVPYDEIKLDGVLGEIIGRCTKKQPRRRYASIEQLRPELYEALNDEPPEFESRSEERIVELLKSGDTLSDEQWDAVFDHMDEVEARGDSNHIIFRAISADHIQHLRDETPELFASLSRDFCKYVYEGTFNFDYCDVLASKLVVMFELGNIEVKALVGTSLLELGTSHNRWYVEWRFVDLFGPDCEEGIVERFNLEAKLLGQNVDDRLGHLYRSIKVSEDRIHPAILDEGD